MICFLTVNDNLQLIVKNQAELEQRIKRMEEKQDSSFLQMKLMFDKLFEMVTSHVSSAVVGNDDMRIESVNDDDESFEFPIDTAENLMLFDKKLQDTEYMTKMVRIFQ